MQLAKKVLALALCIGIVFGSVPNVFADETSELILKILVKKGIITEQEVNAMKAELGREKKVAEKAAPKGLVDRVEKLETAKKASDWAERIKFKGDFRYRHEILWDNDSTTRNRERVRARLEALAKVNEQVDVGLRIVSGNDQTPTSTNQTLRNTFENKPVWLDWAYLNYKPWEWMNVKGGMFKNPFMHTELLWDSDVSFSGVVTQLTHDLECKYLPPTELFANIGEFPIDELAGTVDDPWLLAYQGGFKTKPAEDLKWAFAVAYYQYVNEMGWMVNHATGGNTLDVDGLHLGRDFNLIDLVTAITINEPFGIFGISEGNIPALILKGDAVMNLDGADQNMGWLASATIGHPKVKNSGQWSLN